MLTWDFFLACLLGISTALLYPKDYEKYSSWSRWSPCSISCGEGVSYRYRKCEETTHTELRMRIPREVKGATKETNQTTEIPDDEFGFVFIQDDIVRRKKTACNSLFEKETRKCKNMDCSKKGSTFACSFDRGMCNMTQDAEKNLNWALAFAKTSIFNSLDGSGGYIHVVSNQLSQESAKAKILTPWLQLSKRGYCIDFRYKLYGGQKQNLKIYLQSKENGGSFKDELIWERSGDDSDIWLSSSISLPTSNKHIRIAFEGTVINQILAKIALDDIAVNENSYQPRFWKPAE